jgi:chromate transporter
MIQKELVAIQMLIKLFISFILIGLGAYGGGLVTIPLIQHELVASRHWMRFEEMARILAIAQMTPGPIAINAATFTGFRLSGILGAILATTAVVLPSMLILMIIVPWVEKFKNNRYANRLGQGVQLGVLSLIFYAVWSYGYAAVRGWPDLVIAAGAFLLLIVFERKVHPIIVILICGLIGMFVF